MRRLLTVLLAVAFAGSLGPAGSALPALGRRVVDFPDTESASLRVPPRKGIQPCAEQDIIVAAQGQPRYGYIFRQAAASTSPPA